MATEETIRQSDMTLSAKALSIYGLRRGWKSHLFKAVAGYRLSPKRDLPTANLVV
jgi:hypothetical protein